MTKRKVLTRTYKSGRSTCPRQKHLSEADAEVEADALVRGRGRGRGFMKKMIWHSWQLFLSKYPSFYENYLHIVNISRCYDEEIFFTN